MYLKVLKTAKIIAIAGDYLKEFNLATNDLLNKKLNSVDSSVVDIDSLEGQIQTLNEQSDTIDDDIDKVESDTNKNKELYGNLSERLNSYTGIERKYESYTNLLDHMSTTQSTLDNLKQEVKFKLDKVEKLNKHEYDPIVIIVLRILLL